MIFSYSNSGSKSSVGQLIILAAAALFLSSAAQADQGSIEKAESQNIFETLRLSGKFDSFLDMVEKANLAETLRSSPDITVFAPTDAALDEAEVYPLVLNSPYLKTFVNGHIVKGRYDSFKIGIKNSLPVLNSVADRKLTLEKSLTGDDVRTLPFGGFFSLRVSAGQYLINGFSRTSKIDTYASNGVIQTIDYPICISICKPGSF